MLSLGILGLALGATGAPAVQESRVFSPAWSLKLSVPYVQSVQTVGERLVVVSKNQLLAIDRKSGTLQWEWSMPDYDKLYPDLVRYEMVHPTFKVIGDHLLFAASDSPWIAELNLDSGKLEQLFSIKGHRIGGIRQFGPSVVACLRAWTGTSRQFVTLDLANGEQHDGIDQSILADKDGQILAFDAGLFRVVRSSHGGFDTRQVDISFAHEPRGIDFYDFAPAQAPWYYQPHFVAINNDQYLVFGSEFWGSIEPLNTAETTQRRFLSCWTVGDPDWEPQKVWAYSAHLLFSHRMETVSDANQFIFDRGRLYLEGNDRVVGIGLDGRATMVKGRFHLWQTDQGVFGLDFDRPRVVKFSIGDDGKLRCQAYAKLPSRYQSNAAAEGWFPTRDGLVRVELPVKGLGGEEKRTLSLYEFGGSR